jgi:methylated-DNA-[protein]-cysteine S-methyltransferase
MSFTSAPPGTERGSAADPNDTPGGLLRDHLDTPLGRLVLVAGPRGLRAVLWPDEDGSRIHRALCAPGPPPDRDRADAGRAHLERAAVQIGEYFAGARIGFDLELDPVGTPFQLRVWQALRAIPYGRTRTYAEQAHAIGRPAAARAVGAADGRNPLSIVVPCHRVLGASGRLTGFAGGVGAKAWLLEHERSVLGAC